MFTGLVREIGSLRSVRAQRGLTRLDIEAPATAGSVSVGDSIAVNGICLTVVLVKGRSFGVEAAAETYRLTTLSRWRSGDRVHLEPALRGQNVLKF